MQTIPRRRLLAGSITGSIVWAALSALWLASAAQPGAPGPERSSSPRGSPPARPAAASLFGSQAPGLTYPVPEYPSWRYEPPPPSRAPRGGRSSPCGGMGWALLGPVLFGAFSWALTALTRAWRARHGASSRAVQLRAQKPGRRPTLAVLSLAIFAGLGSWIAGLQGLPAVSNVLNALAFTAVLGWLVCLLAPCPRGAPSLDPAMRAACWDNASKGFDMPYFSSDR
jgi:hypothetical protein